VTNSTTGKTWYGHTEQWRDIALNGKEASVELHQALLGPLSESCGDALRGSTISNPRYSGGRN
jgi:hypothetical protein